MESKKAAYTVKETGELVPLSQGAIYAGLAAGEIPSIKIGRRVLVPAWWIRAQIDGPKTDARTAAA